MDTEILLKDQIDDGQDFIDHLLIGGFDMTAAFWLKASEDDRWYFYIVSPVVDREGPAQAYRGLHALARRIQPHWIDPLGIRLIGPTNPIAQDVMAIHRRAPGPLVRPVRWGGNRLGPVSVEETYLYPLPAVAVG